MAQTIGVTVRVRTDKKAYVLTADEVVDYSIEIAAGENSSTAYQVPGIGNPKLLAVMVDGYDSTVDPVEVRVGSATGYPMACTPVAVLAADVDGGFSDGGVVSTPISLYFNNPGPSTVTVHVIAAGND